jgi:hypothetical protein
MAYEVDEQALSKMLWKLLRQKFINRTERVFQKPELLVIKVKGTGGAGRFANGYVASLTVCR